MANDSVIGNTELFNIYADAKDPDNTQFFSLVHFLCNFFRTLPYDRQD